MKNINIKKLLSGFISLCIIAGMALVTFATDVDMAAFVTKDEYLTKYHEIDYRVDDIDDRLDRLYKFTCTNVRTYGGSSNDMSYSDTQAQMARGKNYLRYMDENGGSHWSSGVVASFREEGFLKVNTLNILNFGFQTRFPKTDTLEKIYPASMIKWRDGIEPANNCSIRVRITQVASTNTTYTLSKPDSEKWEIVMGPFDKYPNPTSAGSAMNQGYVCTLPEAILPYDNFSLTTFEYQTGTETEPTSWRTLDRGSSVFNSIMVLTGDTAGGGGDAYMQSYVSTEAYHNRYVGAGKSKLYYGTALPTAVPAANGNIWLRFSVEANRLRNANIDTSAYNLTTWNIK